MDTISESAADHFLAVVRLVKFCELASTVVTIYDHILTFPREVDLIWTKSLSLPAILYICTRYVGDLLMIIDDGPKELPRQSSSIPMIFLTNCTNFPFSTFNESLRHMNRCFIFIRVQGWACALQFFFMQTILVIRINAVCENSRHAQKVKRYLVVAFIIEIIPLCALLFWGNVSWYSVTTEPLPGVHFCTAINIPRWYPTWWIPVILFDILLFILALKFCLDEVKLMQSLNTAGSHRKNLINVMLRDSILYYFVVLSISVASAIEWSVLQGISYEIMQGFSIAASSMMGCRIVLNLREAVYAPNGGSTIRQSHMEGLLQLQSAIMVPLVGDETGPKPECSLNPAAPTQC